MSRAFEEAVLDFLLTNQDPNAIWADISTGISQSSTDGALWMSLHDTSPGAASSQSTGEVSYTPYQRIEIKRDSSYWSIIQDPSGAVAQYTLATTYPTVTSGSGTAFWWGLGTQFSGAGNLLWWGPIGNRLEPYLATDSGDLFTVTDSGVFADDSRVALLELPGGSSPPTGIAEGTAYWVVNASGNTFQVSTLQGGSAVPLTSDGDGIVCLMNPAPYDVGVQPRVASSGGLVLSMR